MSKYPKPEGAELRPPPFTPIAPELAKKFFRLHTLYVGTRRRQSTSRLTLRITEDPENRDTLIPCDACEGTGTRILDYPDGLYRQVPCKWCHHGFTDKATAEMWARWLQIKKANKCHP